MCRALHALQSGVIVSKPAAARWAQTTLEGTWAALIEWALTWPPADPADQLSPTLDFVRHALECIE